MTLVPTLQGYRRSWLRYDVVAGVAAGTVVIPQAMAYAALAGLPVEVGLFTCMLPMLAYALFGGSRSLSLSTTSTIAVLTASVLVSVPAERTADELLRDAFTLTALVGVCLLLLRAFRLGSLVEQISPATMTGIKTGVGLTVAASQLPTLLGVTGDAEDEGFFGKVADALSQLDETSGVTLAFSVGSVALLLLLRRVAPTVPGALVVTVSAIAVVALSDVEERGLALIGEVPASLPTPTMPMWADVGALLPGAAAISIMAFMETVLVARTQRQQGEEAIDADRELLANGVAAFVGGFSQSMPPAGGFSQSAVNQRSGARSQVAGVTTAVLAVLVALFLGPVLEFLPQAILAAMVLVAVLGLLSVQAFVELFRIDRAEFWVAVVTAAIGLTVGLLVAVASGVALTLVLVLRALSRAQVRPLHRRVDGAWTPSPPPAGAEQPVDPAYLVLHLFGPLYTGNARPTQDAVLAAALAHDPRPGTVVLESTEVRWVTTPFVEAVTALDIDLRREGLALVVAGLPPASLAAARRSHAFAAFADAGGVVETLEEVVPR
jgi:high affinity sulfate transporter 1